jgi:hypothetical protein
MTGGNFKVSRSIFDHPMFDDEPMTRREAWLWLISSAAWQPLRIQVRNGRATELINLERGQLSHSRSFMKNNWKWTSEKKVRTFLSRLERECMIDLQTGQLQTVITICNYDLYQLGRAIEGPANGPAKGQQRAGNGPEVKTLEYIRKEDTRKSASNSEGFDKWWSACPKRVDKIAAGKSFAKVMASGTITLDGLMAATERWCAKVASTEKQFIKAPAVWLNKGGYLDEPDAPAQPAPIARDPRSFTDQDWQKRLKYLQENGTWPEAWGPKPGEPDCLVPAWLFLDPPACRTIGATPGVQNIPEATL